MAYTPINWQTGDTITAEKLNKMDRGWDIENTQLFSETVTTTDQSGMNSAMLAYDGTIDADTITVTFDGTEYTCERIDAGNRFYGGFSEQGPVFTEYPFAIESKSGANEVYTETASTHTIAAAASTMQTSSDFDAARGYGYVTGSPTELFSETVTTELDPEYPDDPAWGNFAYSTQITVDTATVTFDGTDYVCARVDWEGSNAYGGLSDDAPDFSTIPFFIVSDPGENAICTATGGTHTVTVTGTSSSIETSTSFESAVNSVVDTSTMPMLCVSGTTTNAEMFAAYAAGRILFFRPREGAAQIRYITDFSDSTVTFIPSESTLTATFENGVFTVRVSL